MLSGHPSLQLCDSQLLFQVYSVDTNSVGLEEIELIIKRVGVFVTHNGALRPDERPGDKMYSATFPVTGCYYRIFIKSLKGRIFKKEESEPSIRP